jgi:release factor glutamine methyltransferase
VLLKRVEELLRTGAGEAPEREALWLVESITGKRRAELLGDIELDDATARRAIELATRRAAGEPLQYLMGTASFRYLELEVGPGVFIPRPETELLVERAMQRLTHRGVIVDVGTGSGPIALSIAQERPDARVYATENSAEALQWARRNLERLQVSVELIECDLLAGLPTGLRGTIDVVVSNPPYIGIDERHLLAPEVIDHEPHEALFARPNAVSVIEKLAREAHVWLRPGGYLVLEITEMQGRGVREMLEQLGYVDVEIFQDLANRDRIAEARRS